MGFTGCALLGTVPLWLTVSYLGEPDHGVILELFGVLDDGRHSLPLAVHVRAD